MTALPLLPAPSALPLDLPAAPDPSRPAADGRLLVVDPVTGRMGAGRGADLAQVLRRGDLVVVNDAATLPATLPLEGGGELRLVGQVGPGLWQVVEMGAGDWRQDTDTRPAPPSVGVGSRRTVVGGLTARVEAVDARHPRLRTVRFDREGEALMAAIYAAGAPVQYRYMDRVVPLSAVQNVYAGRPWAVEMPSAGRLLSWSVLDALAAGGVAVATLTHAAGLSATGDPGLDARLPLPERYEIPADTAAQVRAVRAAGGRVIAAGTSVVRALEGDAAAGGPGAGVTDLRLGPHSRLTRVDGLISNLHGPGESHFELWRAFAPSGLLRQAVAHAAQAGWLAHEFGDHVLLLAGAALSASSSSR